jgi:large subunit ribosomal protein L2
MNPTSPATRYHTVQTFDDITTQEPHKPLVEPLKKHRRPRSAGASHVVVARRRPQADVPHHRFQAGTSATSRRRSRRCEYDPNRSSRIALLTYADGEKRYIIQPAGLKVGDTIVAGANVDILTGNALPLRNIPLGTQIHNVELRPGRGGQIARSAGSSVQLVAKEGEYATVKMPSGETRQDLRRVLRDHRARSATSITRTCRSARRGAAAGSASARTSAVSP